MTTAEAIEYKRPKLDEAGAAERAGVSIFTVRRWRLRGALAFHRIGHFVRFSEADVDAYLDRTRVPERRAS